MDQKRPGPRIEVTVVLLRKHRFLKRLRPFSQHAFHLHPAAGTRARLHASGQHRRNKAAPPGSTAESLERVEGTAGQSQNFESKPDEECFLDVSTLPLGC